MSIATEISRIQTAEADIKTAITNKGVTVPEGSKIDALPALITSIPSGGGLVFPDLWLSGTLTGSEYQKGYTYNYLVVDCTNIKYLDFTYDINLSSNTSYGSRLNITLQVGQIPYITNEIANMPGWKHIDTGYSSVGIIDIPVNGSSIKGGEFSYDVSDKTVVTISLYKETKVTNGYGSIHIYDIKGRNS